MSKKILALAIGLMAIVAMVPEAQATSMNSNSVAVQNSSQTGSQQIAMYRRKVCRVVGHGRTRRRVCRYRYR